MKKTWKFTLVCSAFAALAACAAPLERNASGHTDAVVYQMLPGCESQAQCSVRGGLVMPPMPAPPPLNLPPPPMLPPAVAPLNLSGALP
ncbi:MAG: hypothetical protein ACRETW_05780 [Stenotrophobium sp.]